MVFVWRKIEFMWDLVMALVGGVVVKEKRISIGLEANVRGNDVMLELSLLSCRKGKPKTVVSGTKAENDENVFNEALNPNRFM